MIESAPTTLRRGGRPAWGRYRGEPPPIDLGLGWLRKRIHRKKWAYFAVFDPCVAFGSAVVDVGYAANVFAWVFDRADGELVSDVARVVPSIAARVSAGPGDGVVTRYRGPFESTKLERDGSTWRARGGVGHATFDLVLDAADSTPVTAICPVDGLPDAINTTRKEVGLRASGEVAVGRRTWRIEDGQALVDYTHGRLARDTRWMWATGCGHAASGVRAGFNVVAGFNDGLENVFWIDGEPTGLGTASFDRDADDPSSPWRVSTSDGRLELELDVEGVRRQDLDLGVVVSRYAQPIGTWRGTIDGERVALSGVAEQHHSRW